VWWLGYQPHGHRSNDNNVASLRFLLILNVQTPLLYHPTAFAAMPLLPRFSVLRFKAVFNTKRRRDEETKVLGSAVLTHHRGTETQRIERLFLCSFVPLFLCSFVLLFFCSAVLRFCGSRFDTSYKGCDNLPMRLQLTPQHWNMLIIVALVFGSGWIYATRNRAGAIITPKRYAAPAGTLPGAQVGAIAPSFRLPSTTGEQIDIASLRGQVALVNIWATWCLPCRAEMPAIQATYTSYRDQGFVVLAINQREEAAIVQSYLEQHQLTIPSLLDTDGAVGALYQANALPSSFLIGRDGTIRAVYRGPLPLGVINAAVAALVAE
jgi:cytochrome c biogenesis protein CcmG, thiol:disulfide interchange protein DsbE